MPNQVDTKDKLVLYLEERFNGRKDSYCYVAYDHTEKEFFICGARATINNTRYGEYHFYCKSTKTLLNYLEFVLNVTCSNLTYGLYAFKNIFEFTDCVNLDLMEIKSQDHNEIAMYADMDYDRSSIKKNLRMLKEVRY